eukprot:scaffold81961_cov30-Tisochrysis_lutea.AAC.1
MGSSAGSASICSSNIGDRGCASPSAPYSMLTSSQTCAASWAVANESAHSAASIGTTRSTVSDEREKLTALSGSSVEARRSSEGLTTIRRCLPACAGCHMTRPEPHDDQLPVHSSC